MKLPIILLVMLAVLANSCDDDGSSTPIDTPSDDGSSTPIAASSNESYDTIYINVQQGGLAEYDTSIDALLEAVMVTDSTEHHKESELFLLPDSTGSNIYHRYKPLDAYLGNDTLKLRSDAIDDATDEITNTTYVTTVFTVTSVEESANITYDTIYVDVKQGETIEYETSIDNFLGGVTVTDSIKYHLLSELFTDDTYFNVHHRFQSLDNYLGNDTLKLKSELINDTSDEIMSIKYVTSVLTVKKASDNP